MKVTRMMLGYGSMMILVSAVALGEGGRREPSAEMKQAFQACLTQIGVAVEAGSRPNLSEEQRQQLGSCLQAKGVSAPRGGQGRRGPPPDHEAMKACLAEARVSLPEPSEPGQRPVVDEATRAAFDRCRAKVGGQKASTGAASAM